MNNHYKITYCEKNIIFYKDPDGILKPNYNTVDLSEVELVDSDGGPRENDTNLMTVSLSYQTKTVWSLSLNTCDYFDVI